MSPKPNTEEINEWCRIESYSRCAHSTNEDPEAESRQINEGLKAKTADPLWFITRQWMIGEFMAEDAGSLVKTQMEYYIEEIKDFTFNTKDGPYTPIPDNMPLETLVERETVQWNWRMRVRSGQQFERFVRESLTETVAQTELNTLNTYFQIFLPNDEEMDLASVTKIKFVAGKVLNGEYLYNYFVLNKNLSVVLEKEVNNILDIPGEISRDKLTLPIQKFEAWYNKLFSQPENDALPQWKTKTLDYSFGVKTDKGTKIVSDNYRNGDLEWYSSNLKEETNTVATLGQKDWKTVTVTPNRVKFAGMPHPRWWVMDDSVIDYGKIGPNTTELLKLMLMNYTLTQGDDWFVVPLALKTGTVALVNKITTTDSFGVTMDITNGRVNENNPLKRWDLFSLSKHRNPKFNANCDLLYIPPSSGFREESKPIEEVLFLRDENANLVFGIEKTVPNAWGKASSALEYYLEKEPEQTSENNERDTQTINNLVWKLATKISPNWIPFNPEHFAEDIIKKQTFLRKAQIPNPESEEEILPSTPLGQIIKESDMLNEETITRAGIKVQIKKQRVRWIDGKTYVWVGRNVVTGRGEGSSGLKWDVILNQIKREVNNGS